MGERQKKKTPFRIWPKKCVQNWGNFGFCCSGRLFCFVFWLTFWAVALVVVVLAVLAVVVLCLMFRIYVYWLPLDFLTIFNFYKNLFLCCVSYFLAVETGALQMMSVPQKKIAFSRCCCFWVVLLLLLVLFLSIDLRAWFDLDFFF